MDRYCLNRQELAEFISAEFSSTTSPSENGEIQLLIERWESWQLELICLATLLSQVLENRQKQSEDVHAILQEVYTLSERKGLLSIEEIDEKFIEYMFRYIRDDNLNIEDQLTEIRRDMSDFRY